MISWGKAIGYGVLVWLVPFVIAFLIFPIHSSNRPLFESIMAVAVCATSIAFGILYLKHVTKNVVKEGIQLGVLWFIIPVLIDAPLMLFGGPMKMSISEYMADIGVTYICIPVITWGLSVAYSRSTNGSN
jgi:biotin transporter BioY